jgi:hypothetical protein
METLCIIDPVNFKGYILNTMDAVKGVHFMEEPTTLEQYKERENNPNLIAIDLETYEREYFKPYLNSLMQPWKETTEERFYDMLNCLPPAKWIRGKEKELFFVGECYTENLYECYIRKGKRYFVALRPISTDPNQLFNLL